jgi:hypothetical protein
MLHQVFCNIETPLNFFCVIEQRWRDAYLSAPRGYFDIAKLERRPGVGDRPTAIERHDGRPVPGRSGQFMTLFHQPFVKLSSQPYRVFLDTRNGRRLPARRTTSPASRDT